MTTDSKPKRIRGWKYDLTSGDVDVYSQRGYKFMAVDRDTGQVIDRWHHMFITLDRPPEQSQ